MTDEGRVPYDENAWERIVADLGDGMPQLPPADSSPPPVEEEEGFEPPPPPPLPKTDLVGKLAWAGTLGGPLLLLLSVVLPSVVGPEVASAGVVAFAAGFLTLVLRHPNEREDGWDDGSVV